MRDCIHIALELFLGFRPATRHLYGLRPKTLNRLLTFNKSLKPSARQDFTERREKSFLS